MAICATLLVGALAGCGAESNSAAPADCTPVAGNKVTLIAENIQWNTKCLKVKAGIAITFTVLLKDEGVKHDLQIFSNGSEKKQTPLEAGPKTQTLVFTFPTAGYYQYVCTIHSNMEGAIYAV